MLVIMATPISSHVKDKNSIFTVRDEGRIFFVKGKILVFHQYLYNELYSVFFYCRGLIFPHWIFLERFHAMRSCPGTYYIIVLEDTELAKIVACGTLFIEQKFIHEIATVCIFILSYVKSILLLWYSTVELPFKQPSSGYW